jgi:hypothetical protein
LQRNFTLLPPQSNRRLALRQGPNVKAERPPPERHFP